MDFYSEKQLALFGTRSRGIQFAVLISPHLFSPHLPILAFPGISPHFLAFHAFLMFSPTKNDRIVPHNSANLGGFFILSEYFSFIDYESTAFFCQLSEFLREKCDFKFFKRRKKAAFHLFCSSKFLCLQNFSGG